MRSVTKFASGHQIIVIDDASSDNSLAWISKTFPQIKVISNRKNIGFAASVNKAVKTVSTDLFLLLNNDISLKKNTVEPLLTHFKNQQVFAVGALEELDGGGSRGRSEATIERGMFIHKKAKSLEPGKTAWVFGASGMFRTSVWNKLGGFDEIFAPAYYEDIDLSYRAWKSGYKCLFEPESKLFHQGEQSMNKALGASKQIIVFRNQLLFFWKNITAPTLWAQHLAWLPYHLIITSIKSKGAFILGFLQALTLLPKITKSKKYKLTDQQVFSQISNA